MHVVITICLIFVNTLTSLKKNNLINLYVPAKALPFTKINIFDVSIQL